MSFATTHPKSVPDKLLVSALEEGNLDKFRLLTSSLMPEHKSPQLLAQWVEPHFFQQIANRYNPIDIKQILKSYAYYGVEFSVSTLIEKNGWVVLDEHKKKALQKESLSAFELGALMVEGLKLSNVAQKEKSFNALVHNLNSFATNNVAKSLIEALTPYGFSLKDTEFLNLLNVGEEYPELVSKILNSSQLPSVNSAELAPIVARSFYALQWALSQNKPVEPDTVSKLAQRLLKIKKYDQFKTILEKNLINVDNDNCALLSQEIGKSKFEAVSLMLPYTQECVRIEALLWDLPNRLAKPELRNSLEYLKVYNEVKIMVDKKALSALVPIENKMEKSQNQFKI